LKIYFVIRIGIDEFKEINMQKIVPHLWYDKEAKDAALFYISIFDQAKLLSETVIGETPSGDTQIISFQLAGQQFAAISAGPYFKFNPSISLMVACNSIDEVNTKWSALSEGGTELMPLGEYPFSKWYGWIQDRYGLSWQLMLVDSEQAVQKITPNLLFSNDACGKAEEAVKFYVGVFENSEISIISRYGIGEATSSKAQVNYAAFKLCGLDFSAMDNAFDVDFNFNEAFSLIINCKDQKEIDYYWDKLSAVPEAEQCGWVKDQFGVSWQIVPSNMDEIMSNGTKDEIQRVTEAFLKMKKFDLNALEQARLGHAY
jgi:predicted 3-demethylubiquinone-9 3-methyltransferase (glyoxalase superfamily)